MLRALSLSALVLLCSAASPLAQRHIATYGGVSGSLGPREGHIRAGGVDKDVTFVDQIDRSINDQIDAVYRTKYRCYAARYIDPVVSPEARAATIKLVPRYQGGAHNKGRS